MAAGDYTIYGRADQPDSGLLCIAGQSAATAADIKISLGFEPTRITFMGTTGATMGATVNDVYEYWKPLTSTYNIKHESGDGVISFVTTTNRAIIVEQASDGTWTVTFKSGVQANSHFWMAMIER